MQLIRPWSGGLQIASCRLNLAVCLVCEAQSSLREYQTISDDHDESLTAQDLHKPRERMDEGSGGVLSIVCAIRHLSDKFNRRPLQSLCLSMRSFKVTRG